MANDIETYDFGANHPGGPVLAPVQPDIRAAVHRQRGEMLTPTVHVHPTLQDIGRPVNEQQVIANATKHVGESGATFSHDGTALRVTGRITAVDVPDADVDTVTTVGATSAAGTVESDLELQVPDPSRSAIENDPELDDNKYGQTGQSGV
jgi:hypothetical protein